MTDIQHGTIDGYTNHKCRCADCRKASADYQRERVHKRQDAYFADKACVKCGSREKLHNHHRDPSTKAPRFNCVWTWSEAKREEELAKCDVLCASCHSTLHNKERLKPIVHGTFNAYSHRNCRCDECCHAWREYQRNYRDANKDHINEYQRFWQKTKYRSTKP